MFLKRFSRVEKLCSAGGYRTPVKFSIPSRLSIFGVHLIPNQIENFIPNRSFMPV